MSEEAIVQDYGKRLREALLLTLTLTLTLTLALTLTLTLTLTLPRARVASALILCLTLTLTSTLTLTLAGAPPDPEALPWPAHPAQLPLGDPGAETQTPQSLTSVSSASLHLVFHGALTSVSLPERC